MRRERNDGGYVCERAGREVAVREVLDWVSAQQYEYRDLAIDSGLEDCRGVAASAWQLLAPCVPQPGIRGFDRGPTRCNTWCEAHVERALHVRTSKRGEKPDTGECASQHRCRRSDGVTGLRKRGPTEHHDHSAAVAEQFFGLLELRRTHPDH